ncbi:MAG: hypothetical protein FWC67_03815 [Defluviitaleaceae bacterium]|nr:hypothetical protein [Defluviitaleaceae bacterium]
MAKVQISQQAFLVLRALLAQIDIDEFSDFTSKKRYGEVMREVEEKHARMLDRMRFGEAVGAGNAQERKEKIAHYYANKGKGRV